MIAVENSRNIRSAGV